MSSVPKEKNHKHVSFVLPDETTASSSSTQANHLATKQTNVPIIASTGVINDTTTSGSKPSRNTRNNRTTQAKSVQKKNVEDHPRKNNISLRTVNRVDSSISFKRTLINSNSVATCKTHDELMSVGYRNVCARTHLRPINRSSGKSVMDNNSVKQVWIESGKVFTNVRYQWKPTGRKFTVGINGLVDNTAHSWCKTVKNGYQPVESFP